MPPTPSSFAGDRLAKVIARAGLCSRRDAELWIKDGRVAVNGKVIRTPAFNVTARDLVKVDGEPLAARQGTRVWLYHRPAGLVVTEKDPEGRPTIFETLGEQGLPRVVSIGRLDINTEGLLLLTNDGGLKRVLELPATGWLRRYRVRAFGTITQPQLDALKDGLEVDGVKYGPIEAVLEREQGSNVWLLLALREGKNREVKNVLAALGLKVNRLIRVSFGPFQLGELPVGAVEVVKARVLREQLGKRLADEAGVDFESELPEPAAVSLRRQAANPNRRVAAPGKPEPKQRRREGDFRFADRPERTRGPRPPRREMRDEPVEGPRRVLHDDGSESEFVPKAYGRKPKPAAAARDERPMRKDFADRPKRSFRPREDADADRPKRDFGSRRSSPARRAAGRDHGTRGGGGGPTRESGKRPKRPYAPRVDGDKPRRPFAARADGDRPKRAPAPRADGDRPKRPFGAKPSRGPRAAVDKPFGKRPPGAGPQGGPPRRPRTPR
jgi:23S rRNA pseudouridine2605 synthase